MSEAYYKVQPGSKAHEVMNGLHERMMKCNKALDPILDEVGARKYFGADDTFSIKHGGLKGMEFKACPPGWRKAYGGYYKDMYFPKNTKANKDLLDRIAALPVITVAEYNALIGYESFSTGRTMHVSWGFCYYRDTYLINMAYNKTYKPLEGMEEITTADYERLKAEGLKIISEEVEA